MTKIIVLDVDGTLVCTQIDWDSLREKIRRLYRLEGPLKPLGESLYKLLGDDEEKLKEAFEIVEKEELESTRTLVYDPRVPDLIAELKEKGYRVVIMSMRNKKTLKPILRKLGLTRIIDEVVTRDEYHTRLEQLRAIVEEYNGEEIVFIGDTRLDEEASKKLGVAFIKATCRSGDDNSIVVVLERLLEGEDNQVDRSQAPRNN